MFLICSHYTICVRHNATRGSRSTCSWSSSLLSFFDNNVCEWLIPMTIQRPNCIESPSSLQCPADSFPICLVAPYSACLLIQICRYEFIYFALIVVVSLGAFTLMIFNYNYVLSIQIDANSMSISSSRSMSTSRGGQAKFDW